MILLSEIQPTAAQTLSSSVTQREPMAAELDEYADAYFLSNHANQLQSIHRELKSFSWIISPLIATAGAVVGSFCSAVLPIGDDPALIGGGVVLGVVGALGFNLDLIRRGRRAAEARARYEVLEAELFPETKEISA